MEPQRNNVTLTSKVFLSFILFLCSLGDRYEISRDPEKWLDINANTGEITAKRTFYIRSPHVKNNIYNAVVKATGQFAFLVSQTGKTMK